MWGSHSLEDEDVRTVKDELKGMNRCLSENVKSGRLSFPWNICGK